MTRELILLTPYRFPSHHTLMLGADDVAILLNGYLALWHPEALRGANGPPKLASPYDHENPSAGFVYAVPESPPLFLPDDWTDRVREAGAVSFKAVADRDQTLANLLEAIQAAGSDAERNRSFFAVGLGTITLETLFEAMDHMNQLNGPEFWNDVTRAVEAGNNEERLLHLKAAAEKLREARDILYPSPLHIVDLALADDFPIDGSMPLSVELGLPSSLIISGKRLERLGQTHSEALQRLRERAGQGILEICSGPYREREDAHLPVESQLWNLRKGVRVVQELLGQELKVYARRRFAGSPELPQLLAHCGLTHGVQVAFDEGVIPTYRSAIVEWSSQDGKRLQAFTLAPLAADSPLTWFHLAHYLSKTMKEDATPALAFRQPGAAASTYYRDWLELNRLAPVFGQLMTLSGFFGNGVVGDYPAPASVDEYLSNYLEDLTNIHAPKPVSRFAEFARARRALEAAWTMAGLYRGLVPPGSSPPVFGELELAETKLETEGVSAETSVENTAREQASRLAGILLSRATSTPSGHLLFNPCGHSRVVGVELVGVKTPLPSPARATEIHGDHARVAVEIPALGFAWLPNAVTAGTKVTMPRGNLAEDRVLRNEYFEAEVDPGSGGLRSIRPTKLGGGRLGQQLCFGPGSDMRVEEIKVASKGPALGEIVSSGAILGGQQETLARFKQRFRVWWGRPILELRIEIEPSEPPVGYPWHAFFGARFAWRDPKAVLSRATTFAQHLTSHTRPESSHYLELRSGLIPGRTAILTGGLPFLQRHSQRMVDVILIPEGETARTFDLAIGMDLEEPLQAALEWITPTPIVPTSKGPPHIGASGWLFHLDAANIVMTSLRPADGDAVTIRLMECRGVATQAELRCARNPVKAVVVDEFGRPGLELTVKGDAVAIDFAAGQMHLIRVEFG